MWPGGVLIRGTYTSSVICRFGFISFNDVKEATRAISDHNGTEVDGISLCYAEEHGDWTPGGGGGEGEEGGGVVGGGLVAGRGRGTGELLLEKFIFLFY